MTTIFPAPAAAGMFLQVHILMPQAPSLLNRDDLGMAKRIVVGDAERLRVSSQCQKRRWRAAEGLWRLADAAAAVDGPRPSVNSRRTFEDLVARPLAAEGFAQAAVDHAVLALRDAVLGKSAKTRAKEERAAEVARDAAQASGADDGDAADAGDDAADDDVAPPPPAAAGRGRKAAGKRAAGSDPPAAAAEAAPRQPLLTEQVVRLGHPEIRALLEAARAILREAGAAPAAEAVARATRAALDRGALANLRAMGAGGAGLDAALHGRMVTSDLLARCDGALHVAHAFTVHAAAVEGDFFTALDDLAGEGTGAAGSGHVNSAELAAGLYYHYAAVDVPLLVANLTGRAPAAWRQADRALAAEVVRRFVHLAATASVGARKGATAPYARAQLVLLEWGAEAPRQLADAFLAAVAPRPDLQANAYRALAAHVADQDRLYGRATERALAALGPRALLAPIGAADVTVPEAADWAAARVREAPPAPVWQRGGGRP